LKLIWASLHKALSESRFQGWREVLVSTANLRFLNGKSKSCTCRPHI
jgi:hypothetical protein